MDYSRFSDRARKILQLALQEAQRLNHEFVDTEHLLIGLIKEGSGVAANVLKNLGIELGKVREEVEKVIKPGPDVVTMGRLPHTPRTKVVLEYAAEEAKTLGHNYVGSEHILLGLLKEKEGIAAQVLTTLGVKLEDVREEILLMLGHTKPKEMATEATVLANHQRLVMEALISHMLWKDWNKFFAAFKHVAGEGVRQETTSDELKVWWGELGGVLSRCPILPKDN